METYQIHSRARLSIVGSWLMTGLVAFLCSVLGLASPHFVQPFAAMFQGIGVELPSLTRLLLTTYMWLLPVLFTALAVFAILKEFLAREPRQRFLLSTSVLFAAVITVRSVIFILYLPLLTLEEKLARAK
jgi:type II secretory pathway component PulF